MNKTEYLVTYHVKSVSDDEDKKIDLVNYYDLRKLLDLLIDDEIYGFYITNNPARSAIPIKHDAAKALKMVISDFHDGALQSSQDELAISDIDVLARV